MLLGIILIIIGLVLSVYSGNRFANGHFYHDMSMTIIGIVTLILAMVLMSFGFPMVGVG